jgi:hypothetical protein
MAAAARGQGILDGADRLADLVMAMTPMGVNPTEKCGPMIQDRRGRPNWTALISLGRPKLVRFAKIRLHLDGPPPGVVGVETCV